MTEHKCNACGGPNSWRGERPNCEKCQRGLCEKCCDSAVLCMIEVGNSGHPCTLKARHSGPCRVEPRQWNAAGMYF